MKKRLLVLGAMLLAGLCAFANGQNEAAGEAKKSYTIKIGHTFAEDTPRHKGLLVFKDYVEKESAGQIKVDLFANGVLGTEEAMQESMKMGNLEAFVGGPFDSLTKKLNLILMPFFFENQDALMRVAHSDIGAKILADGEKNGLKLLAMGDGGSREITNNVREIKKPEDMKGLKVRTPSISSIIECMKCLGANPVSIPFADVYMALKTGVADAQENPLATIASGKFYEVQKYMTYIDYQFHPEVFSMNLKFYNSLPADLQKVVSDGAWKFIDTENQLRRDGDAQYYKEIEDGGCKVYRVTPEEKAAFQKACEPVYQKFIDDGYFTKEELDEVRRVSQGK